jgi:phage terminase Nu1 subunit (DNA packaging protein)
VTALLTAVDRQGEIEIAGRRYVRRQRLAKLLGVTDRTLARWNARGIGPAKITIGKTVLFDLTKLPDWLAARETLPTRNTRR